MARWCEFAARFSEFNRRDGLGPGTGVVEMDVDDDDGMWKRIIEKRMLRWSDDDGRGGEENAGGLGGVGGRAGHNDNDEWNPQTKMTNGTRKRGEPTDQAEVGLAGERGRAGEVNVNPHGCFPNCVACS